MEKTFEELIKEHEWYDRADYAKKEPLLDKCDVLKLMQQVREATIAECAEIVWHEEDSAFIYEQITTLPTDRIKLNEK